MRVQRVDVYHVAMELKAPFRTSFGVTRERHCLLVRLETDAAEGWGEVVADAAPLYSEETVETAWHVLRDFLVPAVLGRSFATPEEFRAAYAHVRRHPMAKAGLEGAFWDAWSRARGLPLWRALGGVRERIEVGVSIGIQDDVPALLRSIESFLARGYRRIKIKIEPGWDVDVVREVRRAFGAIPLMVDANSAYTLADADHLARLDEFGLMMIEQPLAHDDLVDHAQLQRRLRTPICLDESVHHAEDLRRALELGSCRVLNVKVGRIGGLCEVLAVDRLARERGVPLWCGGMLETGVGRLHNVALTTLPGFTLPGDTSGSDRYWHEDLIEPPVAVEPDGTIAVPSAPGIGHEVRVDRIGRVTRRHAAYRAAAGA